MTAGRARPLPEVEGYGRTSVEGVSEPEPPVPPEPPAAPSAA